ncbi:hypothetical protein RO3G_01631 [Rhizopus delemar RA 99-880]|uniref:Uncharacterized protein n=1 Tax=Rhizopus delemar (strain RA 99-880 / ATCC MYA-4621 / FGSC 9543 / NRRL 43880) TaxID=246409 RepID=I1BL47_RHIO9|nr:hypothetical protein RO3G_01631 [Rhizopus delemar RA 99-880]|eukprot:EIE76927.1 hypothetical protein RO3G_01631 [Rhizopus delemar RA 99-880]
MILTASYTIDTRYNTEYIINDVDVLPLWNQYKADVHDLLITGTATVESDVQKLLSQLFGTDLGDGLKQKNRKDLKIVDKGLPLDIEYKIRDTINKL